MLIDSRFRLLRNPNAEPNVRLPENFLTPSDTQRAREAIRSWPGYAPTPLVSLSGIAAELGIGGLWYKDESHRFGVGSFKPMGGGYAVMGILARAVELETGMLPTGTALIDGVYAEIARGVTVACATDGNHGRAVAWAARTFGCQSVVYTAGHVSQNRKDAIAAYGARIVQAKGTHEDAMRMMVADAGDSGWHIVSETENATDPRIAHDTLAGYSTIAEEVVDQLGDGGPPTHFFVQAGVGGLSAATTAYGVHRWGVARPQVVVVEAQNADCVYRSLEVGERVVVGGDLETIMAGLAAGEVSSYAWSIFENAVNAGMVVHDDAAIAAMRLLASGSYGDEPTVGGESGVASLAAAILASQDSGAREQIGIDETSRIVVYGTEGATDEEVYERLVGVAPHAVGAHPTS